MSPKTLRECREALDFSQAAFAAELGVSPETHRVWDFGRRPPRDRALTGRARSSRIRMTRRSSRALVQDCPDSARAVVADQLARSTLLADNLRVKSKVHPKYKTKYHVGNWPEYEQALVRRGDVTLWLSAEAMDAWRPAPSGRPGGPRKFSDVSIMTALMLRLVFRLPLRQTEGFLRSVLALMRTDLEAPDHTTLSRRSQHLDLALDRIPAQRPVHLIVDSTGLSIVGEGEWAAAKHGNRGKRGWKKLHFGVDRSGVIVAQAVTEPTADDATIGISLIGQVDGDLASVTRTPPTIPSRSTRRPVREVPGSWFRRPRRRRCLGEDHGRVRGIGRSHE